MLLDEKSDKFSPAIEGSEPFIAWVGVTSNGSSDVVSSVHFHLLKQ